MSHVHPLAGTPATADLLVDLSRLVTAYYQERPDPNIPEQRVAFGTSGHRGCSFDRSFNELHVLAITQAICEWRQTQNISGPLFLGIDTHALSHPAGLSALEVLAAHAVVVMCSAGTAYTPTPVISHAILCYNQGRTRGLADGIVVTPSHNPPESGGFKYNPPHGGPADSAITTWIETRANQLLATPNSIQRIPIERAQKACTTKAHDYLNHYVEDLNNVVDLSLISASGLACAVDPLGGAGVEYWPAIAERYQLALSITRQTVDPAFAFMSLDWDGRIRMDPSSAYAMQQLIQLKDRFAVAFSCDPDHDRHGIVTSSGLMPANHYLAVAIDYLFQYRPDWSTTAAVGKTLVSSGLIDRVAQQMGRPLYEVPVGFKHFAPGLFAGSLGFAGEESAGASFLRRNGRVWNTDKDGIIAGLLAAEMTARTGLNPAQRYQDLTNTLGTPYAIRIDAPANTAQKKRLSALIPADITATHLAGTPIAQMLSTAPGNGAALGGIKVSTSDGWFAARPSGTEDLYKIYAESFVGAEHLKELVAQAQNIVDGAITPAQ